MEFVIPSRFTAIDDYSAKVTAMQRATTRFTEAAEAGSARVERRFRNLSDGAQKVAMKSALVGAAILGPLAYAIKTAVDYEDKLADIEKTTGLGGDALKAYGKDVLDLSKNTRTSVNDLLNIGEIGGQLGIAQDQLLDFTKSADTFSVALGKDFSGGTEEAVTSITKLTTLFAATRGLKVDDAINRAGSVINELGAKGTATSAAMADFGLRLGSLPAALQPGIQTTLALGAVFEESGLTAERASSGFSRILLDAGNNLGAYAKQLGISKEAAQSMLKSNPTKLVTDLAVSLRKLPADKLTKTLKTLGINNIEQIAVVGALGDKYGRLAELQHVANKAFFEGNSLTTEADKKNNTAAAKLEKLRNNMEKLSIAVGEKLVPELLKLVENINPLLDRFDNFNKEHPEVTAGVLKFAAALGAAAVIISVISTIFSAFATGISLVASAIPYIVTAFNAVSAFFTANIIPIFEVLWAVIVGGVEAAAAAFGVTAGVFIAVAAAIIGIFVKIYQNWDRIVAAFRDGGIIEGLKAIGTTLLDVILHPLQLMFALIAKLPGSLGEAGQYFADGIQDLRATMEVSGAEAVNPKKAEQDALISKQETINTQRVTIGINDNSGGKAKVNSSGGGVPVKISSTQTFQPTSW